MLREKNISFYRVTNNLLLLRENRKFEMQIPVHRFLRFDLPHRMVISSPPCGFFICRGRIHQKHTTAMYNRIGFPGTGF
jgi:hypothetical protein